LNELVLVKKIMNSRELSFEFLYLKSKLDAKFIAIFFKILHHVWSNRGLNAKSLLLNNNWYISIHFYQFMMKRIIHVRPI